MMRTSSAKHCQAQPVNARCWMTLFTMPYVRARLRFPHARLRRAEHARGHSHLPAELTGLILRCALPASIEKHGPRRPQPVRRLLRCRRRKRQHRRRCRRRFGGRRGCRGRGSERRGSGIHQFPALTSRSRGCGGRHGGCLQRNRYIFAVVARPPCASAASSKWAAAPRSRERFDFFSGGISSSCFG